MSGLTNFLSDRAAAAFESRRARVELVLLLISLAGGLASLVVPARLRGSGAWPMGLVLVGLVLLADVCVQARLRRGPVGPRPLELRESPLEIEIPDLDLDANQSRQHGCEVRVLNTGRETISNVKVELTEVDGAFRSERTKLPHELAEPLVPPPFLHLLERIDGAPSPGIRPGRQITRVGLANIVIGRTLFTGEPGPRPDKVFCAFTDTRRLIDMTAITLGQEYRFNVRVTGLGVPPKESAFVMRVASKDPASYRVMFQRNGHASREDRGPPVSPSLPV
jgi:hypothetical protein